MPLLIDKYVTLSSHTGSPASRRHGELHFKFIDNYKMYLRDELICLVYWILFWIWDRIFRIFEVIIIILSVFEDFVLKLFGICIFRFAWWFLRINPLRNICIMLLFRLYPPSFKLEFISEHYLFSITFIDHIRFPYLHTCTPYRTYMCTVYYSKYYLRILS